MKKNDLTRKLRLISNLIMSQPGQQMITILILFKISRSKGNLTIKFGQYVPEKYTQNVMEKLVPDVFI